MEIYKIKEKDDYLKLLEILSKNSYIVHGAERIGYYEVKVENSDYKKRSTYKNNVRLQELIKNTEVKIAKRSDGLKVIIFRYKEKEVLHIQKKSLNMFTPIVYKISQVIQAYYLGLLKDYDDFKKEFDNGEVND